MLIFASSWIHRQSGRWRPATCMMHLPTYPERPWIPSVLVYRGCCRATRACAKSTPSQGTWATENPGFWPGGSPQFPCVDFAESMRPNHHAASGHYCSDRRASCSTARRTELHQRRLVVNTEYTVNRQSVQDFTASKGSQQASGRLGRSFCLKPPLCSI